MYANSFGSIAKVENIVKWAFKEPSANVVSDIFTVEDEENKYFIIAGLSKINPQGYEPLEKVSENIKAILEREKAADMKLAEVKEKVNGLTDLEEIAAALGTTVSTKENLTFASADFDPKFTGAVSVAETGVVSAPFKGSEGIYVYKVTNRSVEPYFTEENAKMKMADINARNSELLDYILLKNVKNNIYLYF
jgi:parvulin-like peptidyl-prolyl isomerase